MAVTEVGRIGVLDTGRHARGSSNTGSGWNYPQSPPESKTPELKLPKKVNCKKKSLK